MGFFKRILGLEKRDGWSSLEALMLAGAQTSAGIAVSPETALKCPAVLASVRVLSESVAQLPIVLYRRGADGKPERAKDHPLYRLIHDAPNEWTGSTAFRSSMMHAILTHGEAFAFVGRARGQVHEIVQAAPRAITTDVDTVTGEPIFRATGSDGHPRVIPREEIVRVHLPGPDPVKGLSLVHEGRDTIGLLMAITQYSANLFRNGARPSGILAIDGKLTKDQRDFMDAYLREHYAGMNSGKTMLLENGARFSPITMTSMDAQVIEQWRHLIAEVARIFRVPLHLIGDLERATSLNS